MQKEEYMADTTKDAHVLAISGDAGDIRISDDAIAAIAGIAATEIEGVHSMAGGITSELIGKLGVKNQSKGVQVEVQDERVFVEVSINLKYNYNIPDVSAKVQERVKSSIENMTGLLVPVVRVRIAGVIIPET